jgi:hypothetical protein
MNHFSNRAVHRSAFPLLVPSKLDKPSVNSVADDKRTIEAAWANSSNDKLQALKQYRRARGLRGKRAKKCSPGHKCSYTVQLHAMHELWELFSNDECQASHIKSPSVEPTS